MFSTMISNQEREMGRWIQQNGGEKAVLGSHEKCAAMIKHEVKLLKASSCGSVIPVGHVDGEEDDTKAIAALRKEYRQDIEDIIQKNQTRFSKLFRIQLDDLRKDLESQIEHQGDRLIKYLKGGPRDRIKDKVHILIVFLNSSFHFW